MRVDQGRQKQLCWASLSRAEWKNQEKGKPQVKLSLNTILTHFHQELRVNIGKRVEPK